MACRLVLPLKCLTRPLRPAVAIATLLASVPAPAQESGPLPSSEPLRWAVEAGYGHSLKVNRGTSEENALLFVPSVNIRLGRRIEYSIEAHFAQYFTPSGYMLGVMPVGARYFFSGGATLPYFSVGAGFGWTNLVELDEIDRRFNFLLQASAGIRHCVGTAGEWTLEVRWDHISNAGTELPNLGLNSVVLLGGWRFR